jgi:hypothetical protein
MEEKIYHMVPERVDQVEIIIEREAQVGKRPVLLEILERGLVNRSRVQMIDADIGVVEDALEIVKMERDFKTREINEQRGNEQEDCAGDQPRLGTSIGAGPGYLFTPGKLTSTGLPPVSSKAFSMAGKSAGASFSSQ